MDVRLPNGKIIRGVPEGTPKDEIAKKAIAAGLATNADFNIGSQPTTETSETQQAQDKGFLSRMSDVFTGADRQTPETQTLKPIGSSPELNQLSLDALKTGFVQTFGGEDSFINRLKETGAKISQDEKGNFIAELPSGRYLVNPPGLDPADIAKGIGQAGAFYLGSRLAPQTILGQAAAGGATSTALQAATDAAGGGQGVDVAQSGIDAALGGAGQAVSNIIGAGGRLLSRGAEDTAADQALNFAKQQNAPIMTGDVKPPQTFFGKAMQSMAEKVPIVGTGGAREAQQQVRRDLIKELSDRYGEPTIEEVTASLMRNANKVKGAAGSRIQKTIADAGDSIIPLSETTKAIDDLVTNMTKPGMAVDQSVVDALQKFKDQIIEAPNNLEMVRQNRTLFRELVKGDSPVLSNTADRANRIVYDALTKDMTNGTKNILGQDAARKLRQADAVYAQEISAIKNTKLKNILAKGNEKPEIVANMLFSKSPSEIGQLYRTLDQSGRQNARAAVVSKAFEQFAINESPERFLTAMNKMSPQISILFKGREREQIKGLLNYLQHTKQASNAATFTPTGQQLIAPAAVFDIMSTGGTATGAAAGIGLISKVYESRPVATLMLRLSKQTPGTKQFEALSKELERAITAQAQGQTDD